MATSHSKNLLVTNFIPQTNTTVTPLSATLKRYTKANLFGKKSGYVLVFVHGMKNSGNLRAGTSVYNTHCKDRTLVVQEAPKQMAEAL